MSDNINDDNIIDFNEETELIGGVSLFSMLNDLLSKSRILIVRLNNDDQLAFKILAGNIKDFGFDEAYFAEKKKSFLNYFTKNETEKIISSIDAIHSQDIDEVEVDCKMQCSLFQYIWVSIKLFTEKDAANKIIAFKAVILDISKMQKAETETRRTLNFFQILLDTIPNPIYYKNLQGCFLGCNLAFEKILGSARSTIIGNTIADIEVKENFSVLTSMERDAYIRRQTLKMECLFKFADADYHTVAVTISPFLNANLTIGGILGVMTDVTEIKNAESKLQSSEEQYRELITNLPNMVIAHVDGHIVFANKEIEKKLNYSQKEIISQKVLSIVDKEYHDIVSTKIKLSGEGGATPDYKIKLLTKFQEKITVTVREARIQFVGQKAFIIMFTDITEREKAEETIRISELRFRTIWENSFDGMRLLDGNGNTVLVNSTYCNIVGKTREELENAPFTIIMKSENRDEILKNFETRFAAKDIMPRVKSKLELWNNKTIWLELSNSFVELPGQPPFLLSIVRDITERVEMEKHLALSQKMESVGILAAGIAHEINTPMQYIGDNTQFFKNAFYEIRNFVLKTEELLKENLMNEKIAEIYNELEFVKKELDFDFLLDEIPMAIENNQTGISQINKIILSLKDFSHPSQKEKSLNDINHGIEVTTVISKNQWKYVAELHTDLQPDLPLVPCIIDEINQVLLNMIINAAHAIQDKLGLEPFEKGKITIKTAAKANFIEIMIIDTGKGIEPENMGKIFDPFFTTKEVGRGTGQGLALAHDIIVNKHSGQISVDSTVGVGTTFIIKLPM